MIFSSESLKGTEYDSIKVFDENESLFSYGLDLLVETDNSLRDFLSASVHKSIANQRPLCESFDIGELISNVIQWFIDMIKKLFNKFKAFVMKILYSDSYIKKNKSKILAFDDALEYTGDRYWYTCTDSNIPKCGLIDQFGKELDDLKTRLSVLKDKKTQPDRVETMNRIYQELKNEASSDYYAMIRSSCIGATYPISEDNWSKELFNLYRNGGSYYTNKISHPEIVEVMNRYENVKKLIKEVEGQKNEIIKSARETEKEIKSINLKDVAPAYSPYQISEEEAFDRIRRAKVEQVSNVCRIYTMAFSAKLDALKESISQDKRVLYEVLLHVTVEGE